MSGILSKFSSLFWSSQTPDPGYESPDLRSITPSPLYTPRMPLRESVMLRQVKEAPEFTAVVRWDRRSPRASAHISGPPNVSPLSSTSQFRQASSSSARLSPSNSPIRYLSQDETFGGSLDFNNSPPSLPGSEDDGFRLRFTDSRATQEREQEKEESIAMRTKRTPRTGVRNKRLIAGTTEIETQAARRAPARPPKPARVDKWRLEHRKHEHGRHGHAKHLKFPLQVYTDEDADGGETWMEKVEGMRRKVVKRRASSEEDEPDRSGKRARTNGYEAGRGDVDVEDVVQSIEFDEPMLDVGSGVAEDDMSPAGNDSDDEENADATDDDRDDSESEEEDTTSALEKNQRSLSEELLGEGDCSLSSASDADEEDNSSLADTEDGAAGPSRCLPLRTRPAGVSRSLPLRVRAAASTPKLPDGRAPDPVRKSSTTLTPSDTSTVAGPDYRAPTPNEISNERLRRLMHARSLADDRRWPAADVELFHRLDLRGFEPLLPRSWMRAFPVLPDALFAGPGRAPYIGSARSRMDAAAQKVFRGMLEVGVRVRELVAAGNPRRAEARLQNALRQCFEWAMRDAGVWNERQRPDSVAIVAPRANEADPSPETLQLRAVARLREMHRQWRLALGPPPPPWIKDKWHEHAWDEGGGGDENDSNSSNNNNNNNRNNNTRTARRDPPPLYAVVLSHSVMAFVSYVHLDEDFESLQGRTVWAVTRTKAPVAMSAQQVARLDWTRRDDDAARRLRTVAVFDWAGGGPGQQQDVWNAFAGMVLAVHAREAVRAKLVGTEAAKLRVWRATGEDSDPDA